MGPMPTVEVIEIALRPAGNYQHDVRRGLVEVRNQTLDRADNVGAIAGAGYFVEAIQDD